MKSGVAIARVHGEHGFSCVIEGLEDECEPGTGWIEEHLDGLQVLTVALVCDLPTLEARWADREGLPTPKQLAPSYESYSRRRDRFDCFPGRSNTHDVDRARQRHRLRCPRHRSLWLETSPI